MRCIVTAPCDEVVTMSNVPFLAKSSAVKNWVPVMGNPGISSPVDFIAYICPVDSAYTIMSLERRYSASLTGECGVLTFIVFPALDISTVLVDVTRAVGAIVEAFLAAATLSLAVTGLPLRSMT